MKKKPYLEQNISNHKLDGSNLDDSIKIFNNLISEGPIYICAQYANKHKATALHKAYWLPCWKFWHNVGAPWSVGASSCRAIKRLLLGILDPPRGTQSLLEILEPSLKTANDEHITISHYWYVLLTKRLNGKKLWQLEPN